MSFRGWVKTARERNVTFDSLTMEKGCAISPATAEWQPGESFPGEPVDLANVSNTYITLKNPPSDNDWAYIRSIGAINDYHLTIDIADDPLGGKFSVRSLGTIDNPDTVTPLMNVSKDVLASRGVLYAGLPMNVSALPLKGIAQGGLEQLGLFPFSSYDLGSHISNVATSFTTINNYLYGCALPLPAGATVTGMAFYNGNPPGVGKCVPFIYTSQGGLIATGPEIQGASTNFINRVPFSAPVTIPSTGLYFVGFRTTEAYTSFQLGKITNPFHSISVQTIQANTFNLRAMSVDLGGAPATLPNPLTATVAQITQLSLIPWIAVY